MKRAWWVLVVIGCGAAPAQTPHPSPPPLVAPAAFDPPQPTLRLPRHFTPQRYIARLAVDPTKPMFDGEVSIEGLLDRRSAMIWMHGKHLEIARAVASDGKREIALTPSETGEYLGLRPVQPLDAGAWTLTITYRGPIAQNAFMGAFMTRWGETPYLSTQFESTGARLVFPCFDEPDRKAVWQLTLDVPKDQVAVSNTLPASTTALDAQHVRIQFGATRPLSSYLVAFAVGPFEVVEAGKTKSGVPVRVFVPHGTAARASLVASIEPQVLDYLEGWFGIPYPYGKMDLVAVPSNHGIAMENVGMIVCDSRYMLFDKPSQLDRYRVVSLFGHETAHQWFGDLVTAAWWDDIWLNESFATWIENKILMAFDPRWPSEAITQRSDAVDADALASARRIRQPIEKEEDIHTVFDGVTYPKGSTVLRMIERQIGEAKFQAAIRHYLAVHADGNATAADLFPELDEAAGHSLAGITSGFFDQAGVPEIAMDLTCDGGGKSVVALAQRRFTMLPSAPSDQTWTVPVCVAYEGPKGQRVEKCTLLDHTTGEVALDTCPSWFAPSGDFDYYRAKLATPAVEAIRDHAWVKLAPAERIAIYNDTYAYASLGQQPMSLVAGLADKLRGDNDALELAVALGDSDVQGWGFNSGLPPGLYPMIPKDLIPSADTRIRAIAEPVALKVGMEARDAEDYGTALSRVTALSAARIAGSHVLDRDAKRLVEHYRALPHESQATVVRLAIAADPKIADKLFGEMLDEPDRDLRDMLVRAFANLADPTRHRAFLDALLRSPKTRGEDLVQAVLPFGEGPRADTEAFVRAHVDELLAKLPAGDNDDFPLALALISPFTHACDGARRDELVGFVHAHFDTIPNSGLYLKQLIEALDQCIAHKATIEPSLRQWLAKSPRR